ncbi:MAG: hypothetical protein QHI48_04380 [Bacteroidota bacterium]|nr:hypothetical protein [Bacteroidota bacterium]
MIVLIYSLWRTVSASYSDVPSSIKDNAFLKWVSFWQRTGGTLLITHHLIKVHVKQMQSPYERLGKKSKFMSARELDDEEFRQWASTKVTECARLLAATTGTVCDRLLSMLSTIKSGDDFHKILDGVSAVGESCDAIV